MAIYHPLGIEEDKKISSGCESIKKSRFSNFGGPQRIWRGPQGAEE
jgi:hypothetical protein